MREASRTSGQPQAARKAGPVIRIAIARGANVVMRAAFSRARRPMKRPFSGDASARVRTWIHDCIRRHRACIVLPRNVQAPNRGRIRPATSRTHDRSDRRGALAADLGTARKWGWFVALGVLMLIAGVIALANLFLATVVSVSTSVR